MNVRLMIDVELTEGADAKVVASKLFDLLRGWEDYVPQLPPVFPEIVTVIDYQAKVRE